MAKKLISWKTRGMNRDTSVSAFNPEFSFENRNIRLSTNDGNTMMSWVNEKGPKPMKLHINIGTWTIDEYVDYIDALPVGTAVLNHKLVLFTVDLNSKNNSIYVLWKSEKEGIDLEGKLLYSGNLNITSEHPLETLVSYESENIQKVYWTDSVNQPRVINIAADRNTIIKWNSTDNDSPFDFVPNLKLQEKVSVSKIFGSGEFPAGVIQYAFTYYNKYGQESNIFHTTPLQYISYIDRGGSPESKIANSFKIKVENLDSNFDYLRIYSILRTSLNATPLVKRVQDIELKRVTGSQEAKAKGMNLFGFQSNLDDFGKTMKVSNFAQFKQIDTLRDSLYVQGAASYGKYLFQAYIAGKYIDVIDLETNQRLTTLETDISYDFRAYHGNVLSFGKEIAPGSSFPYLYYSCESNSSPCILVIRIINSGSSWSGKVVSRIYLPICSNGNSQLNGSGGSDGFSHYYQNGCVDADNGYIWVSGYTMSSYEKNTDDYEGNQLVYRKYKLPTDATSSVYLSAEDVLESFMLPFKKGTQGMVIKGNKLYQCFGYDQNDSYDEYLDCIDLIAKEIVKSYNFPKEQLKGLGEELESPYIYDDNLYLSATCKGWRYYTLWSISFSEGSDSGGVVVPPTDSDVSSNSITFIDTGLQGDTIDPTELLYKGGENIVAETMEQKDGTLFLGNINTLRKRTDIQTDILIQSGAYTDGPIAKYISSVQYKRDYMEVSKEPMPYINTLSSPSTYCGALGFKAREYYRLGVQFQYKNGKWSEPYWVGDAQETMFPRIANADGTSYWMSGFTFSLANNILKSLYDDGYRKARPIFAVPNIADRTILMQGVGCPTVYRKVDRYSDAKEGELNGVKNGIWDGKESGRLYAQSSWLFRCPAVEIIKINNENFSCMNGKNGAGTVSFRGKLVSQYEQKAITDGDNTSDDYLKVMSPYMRSTEVMGIYDDGHAFYVDDMLATIHSPELQFDTSFSSFDFKGCSMDIVGRVSLNHTYSDIDIQTSTPTIGTDAAGFIHRSVVTDGSAALISAPFYEDYIVDDVDNDKYSAYRTDVTPVVFPVHLWQKNGSLNNDVSRSNRSADLLKKKISNYRFGGNTSYRDIEKCAAYNVGDMQLFNSDVLSAIKVNSQVYMGNIETMLTPTTPSPYYLYGNPFTSDAIPFDSSDIRHFIALGDPNNSNSINGIWSWDKLKGKPGETAYWSFWRNLDSKADIGDKTKGLCIWREPVSMKYKSTPHLVVQLNGNASTSEDISPDCIYHVDTQDKQDERYEHYLDTLPMVEITRSYNKKTLYGGTSEDAMKALTWIPCGPEVSFNESTVSCPLYYEWGDTYFQRFECLKTYPYTQEDKNQVIEIASFLVETRVNIDGRYDRNRAQTSNLNMTPQNFNLMNPVYSQMDNFFSYKMLDEDAYKETSYPNTVTWTKTKQNGADVDLWTNITLANTLELDGDKGEITKLTRLNNQLLAFQDSGISQILYNENTQISTTEGVPIEIANSEKVQGKRYLSDTVGCSNKWSMVQTPAGIYFMDSNEKSIYMLNGQLVNISTNGGFNSWVKQNIPSADVKWNPRDFNGFVGYYDKANQDVLFINDNIALAYSEKFNCFTSFYDYGKAPFFCSLDDTGIWINKKIYHQAEDEISYLKPILWEHQAGKYCEFFNARKPFYMTLVANQEPQIDKIFTNLEFRACIDGEGTYDESTDKFTPLTPFDDIEVWNEYQHGKLSLSLKNKDNKYTHGLLTGILDRKFRVWRCDIPRDNVTPSDSEAQMGIKRFNARPLDRIRNPWAYIKLTKNAPSSGELSKIEVHDIVATYFA